MNTNTFYVYILANQFNSVLYTGVTNNLERRIREHQSGLIEGFTQRYRVHKLVYYESCQDIRDAITREKQLKKWNRSKKEELIRQMNPDWIDLSK